MDDDKRHFFSRDNLNKAGWGLIGAAIAGIAGLTYQHLHGPTTVVLDAQQDGHPPLLVKIAGEQAPQPAVAASDIKALLDALDRFTKAQQPRDQTPDQKALLKGLAAARAKVPTLSEQQHSAQAEPDSTVAPMGSPEGVTQYALTWLPKFGVHAYGCPADEIKAGTQVALAFAVPTSFDLSAATDAYAQANRDQDAKHVTQEFATRKPMTAGMNSVVFPATLKPGSYQLLFGFFMKSELPNETPSYYSVRCLVKIAELPASS